MKKHVELFSSEKTENLFLVDIERQNREDMTKALDELKGEVKESGSDKIAISILGDMNVSNRAYLELSHGYYLEKKFSAKFKISKYSQNHEDLDF